MRIRPAQQREVGEVIDAAGKRDARGIDLTGDLLHENIRQVLPCGAATP